MADTNGNGNGVKWAWVAKIAVGATGALIVAMLSDLRSGQHEISNKADSAATQAASARLEIQMLTKAVDEQKAVVDEALRKLRFFRSEEDVEWHRIQERVMRLELKDNRRRDAGTDWNEGIRR